MGLGFGIGFGLRYDFGSQKTLVMMYLIQCFRIIVVAVRELEVVPPNVVSLCPNVNCEAEVGQHGACKIAYCQGPNYYLDNI